MPHYYRSSLRNGWRRTTSLRDSKGYHELWINLDKTIIRRTTWNGNTTKPVTTYRLVVSKHWVKRLTQLTSV